MQEAEAAPVGRLQRVAALIHSPVLGHLSGDGALEPAVRRVDRDILDRVDAGKVCDQALLFALGARQRPLERVGLEHGCEDEHAVGGGRRVVAVAVAVPVGVQLVQLVKHAVPARPGPLEINHLGVVVGGEHLERAAAVGAGVAVPAGLAALEADRDGVRPQVVCWAGLGDFGLGARRVPHERLVGRH